MPSQFAMGNILPTTHIRDIIKDFYSASAYLYSTLNVRVLVDHMTTDGDRSVKYKLHEDCDLVLVDRPVPSNDTESFIQSVCSAFNVRRDVSLQELKCISGHGDAMATDGSQQAGDDEGSKTGQAAGNINADETPMPQYAHPIVGGTFDRMHNGHKILLTETCLLATTTVTITVTEAYFHTKKMLPELILPTVERIDTVRGFIEDVKPSVECKIEYMFNPLDELRFADSIDIMVSSVETKAGAEMYNDIQEKRGEPRLPIYVIELVEDKIRGANEDVKISSSSIRKRLLGTLYHPLTAVVSGNERPYIVGVTGGLASGKSSICQVLESFGAKVINCNTIVSMSYSQNRGTFEKVVSAFGPDVVGNDGEVDRQALETKAFSDKSQLQKLNSILWPEVVRLFKQQLESLSQEAIPSVVVLDTDVLLEASDWTDIVQEVWTTIIPADQAIKRIEERDGLTAEQAQARVECQQSNYDRVNKANVVLSTQWDEAYTRQQVERAWRLLMERIQPKA